MLLTRKLISSWRSSLELLWKVECRRTNSNRASVTRINRSNYPQHYNTLLVLPNGATIRFRYEEPRQIIKLPLDISTLYEEEKLARLAKRKPKEKIVIVEDVEDNYDARKYFRKR